jgi:hypothetical protein
LPLPTLCIFCVICIHLWKKRFKRFFLSTDYTDKISKEIELAIPRSLLRGHLIEGRVRETAGFSVEQFTFIPRQLAAGY